MPGPFHNNPKIGNGRVQLILKGVPIRLKWINI